MFDITILNMVEMLKLYEKGCSLRCLSRIYKISRKSVRDLLFSAGMSIRSKDDQSVVDSKNRNLYNYFDMIDSKEKAYWLGFILADGNVSSNKRTVEIGLSLKDAHHLQNFASIFNEPISIEKDRCRYAIYSTYLCRKLIGLGIEPRKSYVDNISIFNNIPNKFSNSFILGFMDGDGSVYENRSRIITINFTGRKSTLECVKSIIVENVGVNNNKIGPTKKVYRLAWTGNQAIKILDWLYEGSSTKLMRKYNRYINYKIKQGKKWAHV